MDIEVTQANLSKALNIVARIANMRSDLQILNNILLKTEKNRLMLASTNMEIAVTEYIGAKVKQEGGITIPAQVVTEFIANLPTGVVNLKTSDDHHLEISSGKFKSKINGIKADEFPDLPQIDEKTATKYVLETGLFKQTINQVLISVSNDSSRPVLNGVLWQTHDGFLYLASTDGYRLTEKRLIKAKTDISTIVPAQTLQEVLRSISGGIEEIEVLFSDSQVRFRVGDIEIISQLIEGKFPDYRQLISSQNEVVATIDRDDFLKVSRISTLFAAQSSAGVTIETGEKKNILSLQSVASEIGENSSELEAKVKNKGKIVLNPRYLVDVLSVIDAPELNFEFSGKISPCQIKPATKDPDFVHIIMPLKS